MVPERRRAFNERFTDSGYQTYRAALERQCGRAVEFRLSETPCFLPERLVDSLVETSQALLHQLLDNPEYLRAASAVVPVEFRVPNGEREPTFVQVDFGLLETGAGMEPRLVELQAFPSLYGFQVAMAEAAISAYDLADVTPFLHGLSREAYLSLMRRTLVGDHDPAEVVLLEIDPRHQKTWPDFAVTEQLWGVRAVDVRSVVRDGRRLWYDRDGRRTPIARVYNRVIPDELQRKHLELAFDFRDELDLDWTGGPDWFFRISKFSLPWLRHPSVPRTQYLSEVTRIPKDRENWIVKPALFVRGRGHHVRADRCATGGDCHGGSYSLRASGARGLHADDRHAVRAHAGGDPDHDGARRSTGRETRVPGAASARSYGPGKDDGRRPQQRPTLGRCRGWTRLSSSLPASKPSSLQASFLTKDLLRDRLQLQVGRAFVDLADLGVAVELLDRVVLDEAVAAEELHGERRGSLRDLRRDRSCTWRPPSETARPASRRRAAL